MTAAGRRALRIELSGVTLDGDLTVPPGARGLVVFAHGSGSSRFSRRNRHVADTLHARGFGTLLFDLLTADEEAVDATTAHLRFDIALLAQRLVGVTDWLARQRGLPVVPLGYFGASTGAAAALVAAAERPSAIAAVVSRGGRPDLAGDHLARVAVPTLLIVGGDDTFVLELNRLALDRLRTEARLDVVPGAGHLFEEPGALDEVARLAGQWFDRYLGSAQAMREVS